MLLQQGMPFFARKTIAHAAITVDIDQYLDAEQVMHVDSKQSTMGRVASVELRSEDWAAREQHHPYFGTISGQCRIVPTASQPAQLEELDGWLTQGWTAGEDLLQSTVTSPERGWKWVQIWGFADIEGMRYHVRKLLLDKEGTVVKCRLVYDWEDSVKRK